VCWPSTIRSYWSANNRCKKHICDVVICISVQLKKYLMDMKAIKLLSDRIQTKSTTSFCRSWRMNQKGGWNWLYSYAIQLYTLKPNSMFFINYVAEKQTRTKFYGTTSRTQWTRSHPTSLLVMAEFNKNFFRCHTTIRTVCELKLITTQSFAMCTSLCAESYAVIKYSELFLSAINNLKLLWVHIHFWPTT